VCIICKVLLEVQSPGVLTDEEQRVHEAVVGCRLGITGKPLHEAAKRADLGGIASHPVDPGVADLCLKDGKVAGVRQDRSGIGGEVAGEDLGIRIAPLEASEGLQDLRFVRRPLVVGAVLDDQEVFEIPDRLM
jgi:hypothetical protein